MPTVLIVDGFRFYFYSNENDEPVHVHIEKAEANAKWWLKPEMNEAYSYGFTSKQRKTIKKLIEDNKEKIINAWNEYFK